MFGRNCRVALRAPRNDTRGVRAPRNDEISPQCRSGELCAGRSCVW
ncbi:MAG: hypothetical protein LBL66_07015 [Clostridiales bacterium]|nr:hypothetical protein [Clostridiales bacterium]